LVSVSSSHLPSSVFLLGSSEAGHFRSLGSRRKVDCMSDVIEPEAANIACELGFTRAGPLVRWLSRMGVRLGHGSPQHSRALVFEERLAERTQLYELYEHIVELLVRTNATVTPE